MINIPQSADFKYIILNTLGGPDPIIWKALRAEMRFF